MEYPRKLPIADPESGYGIRDKNSKNNSDYGRFRRTFQGTNSHSQWRAILFLLSKSWSTAIPVLCHCEFILDFTKVNRDEEK
jgi:hypothetical protein